MQYSKFEHLFGDWGGKLRPFIESEGMDRIYAKLKEDSQKGRVICPSSINTYRAFDMCKFRDLKVVIMGMDPYPYYFDKSFVADGLAFSCSIMDKTEASLRVLYEAVEDDLYGGLDFNHEKVNDLSYLAEQGVLLLNSALTVEKNSVGSHIELWKPFMIYLIEEVLNPYTMGTVFIMMGEKAQYFTQYINPINHWVFEVEHPANAARKGRKMIHNNVFSKSNQIIKDWGGEKIQWLKQIEK